MTSIPGAAGADEASIPSRATSGVDAAALAEREAHWAAQEEAASSATRDIADVPAVEVITTTAVHLMSAAAVKCGLADDPDSQMDLDEARKLINSLAGLITAAFAALVFAEA